MISQYLVCQWSYHPAESLLVAVGCRIVLNYKTVLSYHGCLFSIIIAIVISWIYRVPQGKSFPSPVWYSHTNIQYIGAISRARIFIRSHSESHESCDSGSQSFWSSGPYCYHNIHSLVKFAICSLKLYILPNLSSYNIGYDTTSPLLKLHPKAVVHCFVITPCYSLVT
jgi:hypothetical protein